MKTIAKFTTLMLCVVVIASCGKKTVEFDYIQKDMEFIFEPPFVGPDTKSFEVNLNLDSAFAANKADISKIDKVLLDNITLEMTDGKNFDNFSAITVDFQSDKKGVDLLTVGTGSVEKGKSRATFKGSTEKNADDFFNEKKFNVLLNSTVKAEDTARYVVKGSFTFKVKAEPKN